MDFEFEFFFSQSFDQLDDTRREFRETLLGNDDTELWKSPNRCVASIYALRK